MYKYHAGEKIVVDYASGDFQPCWTCKNACGGCEWSKEFKPVPGWIAAKNVIKSNGEYAETYRIIKCPKYNPDRRYGNNK